MNYELFQKRYQKFQVSEEDIQRVAQTIKRYEDYIGKDVESTDVSDIRNYMNHLIEVNENKYNNVIHLARYFYYVDKKQEYIHMTKYFNSIGVLENIVDRIGRYESTEVMNDFMDKVTLPPFGTDSEKLPSYALDFLEKLHNQLSTSSCHKILAGNNHNIPKEPHLKEKERYEEMESLSAYLKDRHERKVEELTKHYQENKVWFEQIITKEALEYVASNQEILSGVIEEDTLYVTKIPYDIKQFLETEDDVMKRYYACHCSFVRENIKTNQLDMPKDWCYCSGGFAKYPFEILLGQELDVTLLETPLAGDYVCRFAIDLSNVAYKK